MYRCERNYIRGNLHRVTTGSSPEFDSRQGQEIFLLSVVPRPALGFIRLPIQWVPGLFPRVLSVQGREADHSSPTTVEVKNGKAVLPLLHMPSWLSAQLHD
jgi:hypothetical protein